MSRSELYNGFRHTRNIQHMVIVCQCCEPLFVLNGLFPLTADEESLHRTVEEQRKSGSSSGNPREEQMRLKEKTPMITQTLLDAQRAAMSKDGIGLNRLSAGRAATDTGGNAAADSEAQGPEAEWRTLSKPSAAMARKGSLPQDLSWPRSNCLLADGLLKQWMLHCRKKRTRRPCETASCMRVF